MLVRTFVVWWALVVGSIAYAKPSSSVDEQVSRLEAALSKFSADERITLRAYEANELDQLGQLLFTSTVCSSRNRAGARKDFAVKLRALERLLSLAQ